MSILVGLRYRAAGRHAAQMDQGRVRAGLAVTGLCLALAAGSAAGGSAPVATAVAAVETSYQWPLGEEPRVVRRFEPPARRWLPGHRGVDLTAEPGAVVLAAGPGTVYFAGEVAGIGVVSITHPGGLRTTYQPLEATVPAGEQVRAGDPIGVLAAGHAGCLATACLHWGLRQGDFYLDPLSLLGLGQVRLLPRGGGWSVPSTRW